MRVNHQELYEITERDTIYKPWDDKHDAFMETALSIHIDDSVPEELHDVLGEQAVNDIVEAEGIEIEEG